LYCPPRDLYFYLTMTLLYYNILMDKLVTFSLQIIGKRTKVISSCILEILGL
jgi:hypothetical protein